MESQNHTFLQAVRLPHAELWYSRDDKLVHSTDGDVQVIYSQPLDKFILRLNDFKILLDKSMPVISSVVGIYHRQAFIFPRGVGFSMIRFADDKQSPALHNFETILENTTTFSRRSGLESTLSQFKEHRDGGIASSLLSSMSKAFASSANNDSHLNQRMERSLDEIKDLDSHGTSVVDVNDGEIESLGKKNELDSTGSQGSELWKSLMGEASFSGFSRSSEESQTKEGHQKTSDIEQPISPDTEDKSYEMKEMSSHPHKYHPSIDHQEVVGAQEQRLPSYEVHNSKEFLRKNLRKASASFQPGEEGSGDEKKEKQNENMPLPEPEDFDDEAFTFGLLTKDHKEAGNVGTGKTFPISNEDAFADLTHPMRKFSLVDRPFLNIDEENESAEAEPEKPKAETHKGFTGQPILTAKGQPTLKSNIDDQPSPIPNTEKYSEPTQPEKSSFAKSMEAQPMQPSNTIGQQNIVRESSQGNETKKHRKIANEPVDKENLRAPTSI